MYLSEIRSEHGVGSTVGSALANPLQTANTWDGREEHGRRN